MEKFVETGVALFIILKGLLSLYDFQSKVAIRFRKIIYIEILPNRLVDIDSLVARSLENGAVSNSKVNFYD